MIELREEASVIGPEIRLRQVARWARADNAFFAGGLSDLIVLRLENGQRTATLELNRVQDRLAAAGVALAEVSFRGAARVRINRLDHDPLTPARPTSTADADITSFLDRHGVPSEADGPGGTGLQQQDLEPSAQLAAARWPASAPEPASATDPRRVSPGVGSGEETGRPRTLREALVRDLADRLGLRAGDLELSFDEAGERVVRVAEPMFRWTLAANRIRNLGSVTWVVTLWPTDPNSASPQPPAGAETVRRGDANARRIEVTARARLWQEQVITRRALVPGQLVREEDIEVRRVLVDRLPDEALLTREQALMMQAGRALTAGTVLAGRMLEPVLLVRAGQLVSVSLRHGTVEVRAVARALEGGAYGQTIRVRSEQTNDVLQVTVTGPQEARLGPGSVREPGT